MAALRGGWKWAPWNPKQSSCSKMRITYESTFASYYLLLFLSRFLAILRSRDPFNVCKSDKNPTFGDQVRSRLVWITWTINHGDVWQNGNAGWCGKRVLKVSFGVSFEYRLGYRLERPMKIQNPGCIYIKYIYIVYIICVGYRLSIVWSIVFHIFYHKVRFIQHISKHRI